MTAGSLQRSFWPQAPSRSLPARYRPALGPTVLVAVFCALWLWHTPPVGDLAAQRAWGQLVERAGYVPWFTRWYGGVPVGGYSLVTPGLFALVGVRTVAVVGALGTVLIATALLRSARNAWLGSVAFGVAAIADLYSGRVTFAVGGLVALATILALHHRQCATTVVLAVFTTVTSPVAGLFLLVPLAVFALADRQRRPAAAGSGFAITVVAGVISVLFPVGGRQPFAFFVFRPAIEITLAGALFPVGRRVRIGFVLASAAIALSYYVAGPMGSNSTRLAILAAVPALVAACRLPRAWILGAAVVLGLWPWHQLHDELVAARAPSAQRAYTAGLERRLAADPRVAIQRVEVVDTRSHTAMARLADERVTLARGWIRQADEGRNSLFYGRSALTAGTYRTWLDAHAVAYVALPNDPDLDFGSAAEGTLVRRGLPYLRQVWTDGNWQLFAVSRPAPVAAGVARVTGFTDTGLDLVAQRPGDVVLALRWSRWLTVDGGTVHRLTGSPDHVRVTLATSGAHRVHGAWRL